MLTEGGKAWAGGTETLIGCLYMKEKNDYE